jgi:hypothetical protein
MASTRIFSPITRRALRSPLARLRRPPDHRQYDGRGRRNWLTRFAIPGYDFADVQDRPYIPRIQGRAGGGVSSLHAYQSGDGRRHLAVL